MASPAIERILADTAPMMEEPVGGTYMAVLLFEDIDPFERHYRYGAMLDAELRLAGVGCADGGGTLFDAEDEDGESAVLFTVLDIDATDIDAARTILRTHLSELGCPAGTLVQFDDLEDRYDGEIWHLAEPRSFEED